MMIQHIDNISMKNNKKNKLLEKQQKLYLLKIFNNKSLSMILFQK